MQKLTLLLFFLFIKIGLTQNTVLDKTTNKTIENVTIDFGNSKGTFTDNSGEFTLPKQFKIDTIKITAIGYQKQIVSLKNSTDLPITIYLEKEVSNLEEVFLINKSTKTLKHKKGINSLNIVVKDFTYEQIAITYIPFPEELIGKQVAIKSIVVNTRGLRSKKRRYYPFKVNLYNKNNTTKYPNLNDSLFKGMVTSRKKGQSHIAKVNTEEHNIKFNKEGIFVAFETIKEDKYPKEKHYKVAKFITNNNTYQKYAAAVKTINRNKKNAQSYSYSAERYKGFIKDTTKRKKYFLKREKKIIYDLTIEIEY